MAIKLEGGGGGDGKALVAGPPKNELFFASSLRQPYFLFWRDSVYIPCVEVTDHTDFPKSV